MTGASADPEKFSDAYKRKLAARDQQGLDSHGSPQIDMCFACKWGLRGEPRASNIGRCRKKHPVDDNWFNIVFPPGSLVEYGKRKPGSVNTFAW